MFAGGVLAALADAWHRRRDPNVDLEQTRHAGFLFAAGLIAGEALIGVLIAIPIVATDDAEVMALPASLQFGQWLGLIVVAAVAWWM